MFAIHFKGKNKKYLFAIPFFIQECPTMIHPRILSTAQKLDRKFSLLMWNCFDLVGQFLRRYNLEEKKGNSYTVVGWNATIIL